MASLPHKEKLFTIETYLSSSYTYCVSKRVSVVGVISDNNTTLSQPHTSKYLLPGTKERQGCRQTDPQQVPSLISTTNTREVDKIIYQRLLEKA
jgi:hypothetical protein